MKKLVISIFALLVILSGCGDDDEIPTPTTGTLTINIAGLENLGASEVYEGWIITPAGPVSTGIFTIDDQGAWTPGNTFEVLQAGLDVATKFVLTIEPTGETGAAAATPSDLKILAGDFNGTNSATVNSNTAPAALGDFSGAWAKYFLRTPTDEPDNTVANDENGIWFGEPQASGPPASAINLPALPAGWIYEGWVVAGPGMPLSTGTFSRSTTDEFAIRDSGNPFSGTVANMGPPVPGEDFLMDNVTTPTGFDIFPLDVRGKMAVISIEPVPDNSPAPFLLKPVAGVIEQATAPEVHTLMANGLPNGTVTK